jgi:glucose/arabinose dehydrogenase
VFLAACCVAIALQTSDRPGARHLIRVQDLPRPYANKSKLSIPEVTRGTEAPIRVPPGFKVNLFADRLMSPRMMAVAPNGDVFVAESYRGTITIVRSTDGAKGNDRKFLYAEGLNLPYGMVFHDGYLYVANTNGVVRFAYTPGQTVPGLKETVISGIPSKGYRQHWTRNILFSQDGKKLFVTVGSETNKDVEQPPRGCVMQYEADGSGGRVFANGLRNPVALAYRPGTSELWATCIERDYMGDDLVPDFATRVQDGQFFGWPWWYLGKRRDPRVPLSGAPSKPVTVPDVLFEAHSVPLGLTFYQGSMFPAEYRGDAFVAMRGSTNRRVRSGYKIVRLDFKDGKLQPGFVDFAVGWVPDRTKREVYGRPVAVAVWSDGSLLVADEPGHKIYRISR